jgi:hypothetical protein
MIWEEISGICDLEISGFLDPPSSTCDGILFPTSIKIGWLAVTGTMEFYVPYIGNVIIPTDELHHFSEG